MKQTPDKPLWLNFGDYAYNTMSMGEVRDILAHVDESELEWRGKEAHSPVPLPTGADYEATLDAIVAHVERFGKILDPNGPTYQ